MRRPPALVFALLLCCLCRVAGHAPVHAGEKARDADAGAHLSLAGLEVGDWVRYAVFSQNPQGRRTLTVTDKTDKTITVRVDIQAVREDEVRKKSRHMTLPLDRAYGLECLLAYKLSIENPTTVTMREEAAFEIKGRKYEGQCFEFVFRKPSRKIKSAQVRAWLYPDLPFGVSVMECILFGGQGAYGRIRMALEDFGDAEHPDPKADEDIPLPPRSGTKPRTRPAPDDDEDDD